MSNLTVGNMITFHGKTSNETLDNILRELTHKVIMPSYLPIPIRKKIFRTRWKTKLETEPIEIELNGKTIKFKHIDNVPNSRQAFFQAMDAMATKEDWRRFPKLLEALWFQAKRTFKPGDWPRMIRKAGETDNLGPIFEAARVPARTGMALNRHEVAQELMTALVWNVTDVAERRFWRIDRLSQALRDSMKVIELLQEEEHQLHGLAKAEFEKTGQHPLHRDPQLMAHPVIFAAALCVKPTPTDGKPRQHGQTEGKPEEFLPVLKKYAELMLERWPEGKGLLELHPHSAYIDPNGVEYLMEKGKFLAVASPLMQGFRWAAQALEGDPMAREFKSRSKVLAKEVKSAVAAEGHKNQRGQEMYDRVFKTKRPNTRIPRGTQPYWRSAERPVVEGSPSAKSETEHEAGA